jgi:dUTP pyrophosphatase
MLAMADVRPPGAALSARSIRTLIERDPPLISGIDDLALQLQPNGFDLRLAEVHRLVGGGAIDLRDRLLPERVPIVPDDDWFVLPPGIYGGVLHEIVALPTDVMALGRPRSTLARSGVAVHTAVWDAGYVGRSEVMLHVANPDGVRIRVGARIVQLVFFWLDQSTSAYSGTYQRENLRQHDS